MRGGRVGALIALVTAALGAAAPAAADPGDAAFLAALEAHGIGYASPQAAIVAAHIVCDRLQQREPALQIVNDVMSGTNLDGYRAGFFVGAAIGAYCPKERLS